MSTTRKSDSISLAIENVDKTAMAEVAKVSSAIDLGRKHSW